MAAYYAEDGLGDDEWEEQDGGDQGGVAVHVLEVEGQVVEVAVVAAAEEEGLEEHGCYGGFAVHGYCGWVSLGWEVCWRMKTHAASWGVLRLSTRRR